MPVPKDSKLNVERSEPIASSASPKNELRHALVPDAARINSQLNVSEFQVADTHVIRIRGNCENPESHEFVFTEDSIVSLVIRKGCQVIVTPDTRIAGYPGSILLMKTPITVRCHFGRGEHESAMGAIDTHAIAGVEGLLRKAGCFTNANPIAQVDSSLLCSVLGVRALDSVFPLESLSSPLRWNALLCLISECFIVLSQSTDGGLDFHTNSHFERVRREVDHDPTLPWNLREASERIGYSPFHFSRAFRLMTGFGFPDYVERARLKRALKLILESSESIEALAFAAGFGSSAALRNAFRFHIGFVPSEIRQISNLS